jgi:flavin-dependent thymidylate synthase
MIHFVSPAMTVRLTKAFEDPVRNVAATAKTCYSTTLVKDEDAGNEEAVARMASIVMRAGHHTTFQHPHFQFSIEGVSRLCVWEFLHAHPYYNSEQQSQRYTRMGPDSVVTPRLSASQGVYDKAMEYASRAYERLIVLLRGPVTHLFHKTFPSSERNAKKHRQAIEKRCQEVARAVLPLGTTTNLYHTVSGLVVARYVRSCLAGDAPSEQNLLAEAMRDLLVAHDPGYRDLLQAPAPPESFPSAPPSRDNSLFAKEFDDTLDGLSSKLVSHTPFADAVVADAVRVALGRSSSDLKDEEAIALALDPERNRSLGECLNLTDTHRVGRALRQATFTFLKKLSHAADSQGQRHRAVQGVRASLLRSVKTCCPDYVAPRILREEAAREEASGDRGLLEQWLLAIATFKTAMAKAWEAHRIIREESEEASLYVLPNATSVRLVETGDLSALSHKYRMRLCYLAQEEIWKGSVEEVEQIAKVAPTVARWLLPPCTLRKRAGVKPFCPEGSRYCGVRVWDMDVSEYEREL